MLRGRVPTESLIAAAARAAAEASRPITDIRGSAEARRALVETLTGQVVRQALRAAKVGVADVWRPTETCAASTVPAGAVQRISLTVNGKSHEFDVQPQETFVEFLRERLRFMRTKEGCGVGECGSCTVIMDKKAVASCLVLAVDADGSEIVTAEGMSCDSRVPSHAGIVRRPSGYAGPRGGLVPQCPPGIPHLLPPLLRTLRRQGDGRR